MNLTVSARAADIVTNETICQGTSFVWNGLSYSAAGTYTIAGIGCEANQILNLTVSSSSQDVVTNAEICQGGSYAWSANGQTYLEEGVYTFESIDANGCPFQMILMLSVTTNGDDIVTNANICAGSSYEWNGEEYSLEGQYVVAGAGVCAGDQILNLTIMQTLDDVVTDASICAGEMYAFGGQFYGATGTYTLAMTDDNGCAFNAVLNLEVTDCGGGCDDFLCFYFPETLPCNGANGSATLVAQGGTAPYSYLWADGQTTATAINLAAGSYGTTITDANGCESIATIVLESDPSCAGSSISLTKLTNGINTDLQMEPVIIVAPGTSPDVEWTYEVTNTGSTTLTDVQVTDDVEGFICTVPSLAPGETQTCTHIGSASLGLYENVGIVTGTGPGGSSVSAQDTSMYIGAYINVEKTADKSCVCPGNGDEVEFTLTIRLLGGAPGIQIGNISVADSHLPLDLDINSPEFVQASDVNGNGFIDFVDADGDGVSDEEFLFKYTLTVNETITNTAMDMGEVFFQGTSIGMANNESSVTITASDDCCANTGNCDLIFKPTSVTGSECGESNGVVDILVVNGIAPYNYVWSNGATTEDLFAVTAGTYTVTVTDAAGCTAVESATVQGGDNCGHVGNYVFEDLNTDGIQDANEPGIPNVQVQLYDANTNEVIANTFTDANGQYSFDNLGAGSFYIKFVQLPATYVDYIPTFADQTVDGIDSDITNNNGVWTTDTFTLATGEVNDSFDAGFYEGNVIGNQVWFDASGVADNEFDSGDTPFENLEVNLFNAVSGEKVATRYTDPFGRYLFQQVPAGTYFVEFMAPAGMTFIEDSASGDDMTDSDAVLDILDPQIGRSHEITVTTGTVDLTIDAGVKRQSSVLAIDLLGLEVAHDSDKYMNILDWTTAREVNSDFFSVERSIDNTDEFEEIGTERASGNTSSETEYFYNDKDLKKTGQYYYRLKMVDLDGSYVFSNVVSVKVAQDNLSNQKVLMDVYPNPVTNQINIDLTTEFDSQIDGGIYDAIGQLIKKVDNNSVTAGKTSMKMDISELPAGTYLLRMQVGKQVIFEKVSKAE